jgi:hypothetical protein
MGMLLYVTSGDFLDFLTLEDGTDRLPQTLVRNYNFALHNNPEEYRSLVYS